MQAAFFPALFFFFLVVSRAIAGEYQCDLFLLNLIKGEEQIQIALSFFNPFILLDLHILQLYCLRARLHSFCCLSVVLLLYFSVVRRFFLFAPVPFRFSGNKEYSRGLIRYRRIV